MEVISIAITQAFLGFAVWYRLSTSCRPEKGSDVPFIQSGFQFQVQNPKPRTVCYRMLCKSNIASAFSNTTLVLHSQGAQISYGWLKTNNKNIRFKPHGYLSSPCWQSNLQLYCPEKRAVGRSSMIIVIPFSQWTVYSRHLCTGQDKIRVWS